MSEGCGEAVYHYFFTIGQDPKSIFKRAKPKVIMADFFNTPSLGMYFHYIVFFMVLWSVIQCARGVVFDNQIVAIDQILGMLVAVVIIAIMGMRPISGPYGDTVNYAAGFDHIVRHPELQHLTWSKEWLHDNITWMCAKIGNIHLYFTIYSTIYVGALWLALRRIFSEYNFIPFVVVISMFTFWMYGVNGVRNGVGASLFILAMTYTENIPMMIIIALMGAGVHNTVYLMIAAALLAWFVNDSRLYIAAWFLCIILSFFFGESIQAWMAGFADSVADDNKLTKYLADDTIVDFRTLDISRSFRWDFLAYSALGVVVAAYFLFRRLFQDEYYRWIVNIYIICNAFWVLIIRAPYSNRFAQISWFILPVVLIYPFMRERFWKNQERMLAVGILMFYAFGFYTNMLPILLR